MQRKLSFYLKVIANFFLASDMLVCKWQIFNCYFETKNQKIHLLLHKYLAKIPYRLLNELVSFTFVILNNTELIVIDITFLIVF